MTSAEAWEALDAEFIGVSCSQKELRRLRRLAKFYADARVREALAETDAENERLRAALKAALPCLRALEDTQRAMGHDYICTEEVDQVEAALEVKHGAESIYAPDRTVYIVKGGTAMEEKEG